MYLSLAIGYLHQAQPSPEMATTGAEGRFKFTASKAKFGDQYTVVAAMAAKLGAGWVNIPPSGKRDDLTIQLVEDDVPITGQIVDLEGKPTPGATVQVLQINAAPREDLGPWLEAVKDKKKLTLETEQLHLPRFTIALTPKLTTGVEGRFRLTGIGRNRLVKVQLDGPTIASQQFSILTRAGKTIEVQDSVRLLGDKEYPESNTVTTYYGADFRHPAAPTKPILGVVRDKDTQKPLAGVAVRSYAKTIGSGVFHRVDIVQTTTDAQGRYRLTGLPKGGGYKIAAMPTSEQPYVAINMDVPDSLALDPVTVDFEMKRSVWIEGKLTDKVTGNRLQGTVEYFSLSANPNIGDYPGFEGTFMLDGQSVPTKSDGSYRIVGLPGPGLIAVRCHKEYYQRAPDRDDEFAFKTPQPTSPYYLGFPSNYNAIARIDPAKGIESVKQDVTIDPGWAFTGKVVGQDGKPLAGVRSFNVSAHHWDSEAMAKDEEFAVRGFNPQQPRQVLFIEPAKGLVGKAQPPKEKGGSVTVQMEPGTAIAGRLVDAGGKPRAGVEVEVSFYMKDKTNWQSYYPDRIKTDREGRFRIEALVPDFEYRLVEDTDVQPLGGGLSSGETKQVGDVRIKKAE